MTVGELRAKLKEYPDNAIVQVSSDPEGNSFYDIYEITFDTAIALSKDKKGEVVTIFPNNSIDYAEFDEC